MTRVDVHKESFAGVERLRLILRDRQGQPQLNALVLQQLLEALKEDACEGQLVSIEGLPGHFCAGLEMSQLLDGDSSLAAGQRIDGRLALYGRLLRELARAPGWVVALIDGLAQGGGTGLAAVADLILATPRASFALPETLMGLVPAQAFPYVAQRIGVPRARLMALGLPPLVAAQAYEWGLVDEVVPDLESALARYTSRFRRMSRSAIASLKALVSANSLASSEYEVNARRKFVDLSLSPPTRQRLARFLAGDTPWPDGLTDET